MVRFALLQRRDLLGQVLRPTATRPILLGIGPVQAAQIVGQTLVRRADHLHQLLTGEVAVRAIDRFQPGPVDGKQFSSEQFAAEEHELTEDRLEGVSVVLAKIRNGLEVGSQATQQPHHFQIAGGLRLEPPAGAHPIDVSINAGRLNGWCDERVRDQGLDAATWDAFARLAEKHNGMGFGGCWCTWFHSRVGRPEGEKGRPWKERLVREGNAHAALVFDGDAAVPGPSTAHRTTSRTSTTARNTRRLVRRSCPTIASRASSSTGTIDGQASQAWRCVVPLT